jgi:hypothetical protein
MGNNWGYLGNKDEIAFGLTDTATMQTAQQSSMSSSSSLEP